MSSVPISGHVRRASVGQVVETNIRLVNARKGVLSVRRVQLDSNDRCVDLQQKVCTRLRDDGVPSAPSPWDSRELVVPLSFTSLRDQAQGEGWHSRLVVSAFEGTLHLNKEREQAAAAELVQRSIICDLEQSGQFWWLSESSRLWYSDRACKKSCVS
jgi:hypothetical protein